MVLESLFVRVMIYCSVAGKYGQTAITIQHRITPDKLGLQIIVQKGKDSLPGHGEQQKKDRDNQPNQSVSGME